MLNDRRGDDPILKSFRCSAQSIGTFPLRNAPTVSDGGCRPSTIASMMSGAKKAEGRCILIWRADTW
jgi:hypothetical protein